MYDQRVMHDGFLNTHSLFNGGKKITLVPLSPSQCQKSKPQQNRKHLNLFLLAMNHYLIFNVSAKLSRLEKAYLGG